MIARSDVPGIAPLIAEYDSDGNLVVRYHHGDGLIAMHRDGNSYWYAFEAIGTTRQLTGLTQVITDSYTMDAWGNILAVMGTTANPFTYVGKESYYTDRQSNLILLGVRYYGAGVGRFITRDILILEDPYRYAQANPVVLDPIHISDYSYADANPCKWIDSTGLQSITDGQPEWPQGPPEWDPLKPHHPMPWKPPELKEEEPENPFPPIEPPAQSERVLKECLSCPEFWSRRECRKRKEQVTICRQRRNPDHPPKSKELSPCWHAYIVCCSPLRCLYGDCGYIDWCKCRKWLEKYEGCNGLEERCNLEDTCVCLVENGFRCEKYCKHVSSNYPKPPPHDWWAGECK